ncbi:MAG TPA: hypothetical protein PLV45_05075 [bacterium]|nr:hypothetical protein [bacterium]
MTTENAHQGRPCVPGYQWFRNVTLRGYNLYNTVDVIRHDLVGIQNDT